MLNANAMPALAACDNQSNIGQLHRCSVRFRNTKRSLLNLKQRWTYHYNYYSQLRQIN